ncbi:hypothetical protein [Clostridium tarantellae]|uniref:Uncharacterized protein n=1 Tax=Clostridium tarantellae TaxID=39493 RepID=A0A6I1MI02_9CLOT|nr:hypothetical protein [Clostridium tarantellae]MPQ42514.1 hypothetical protein [Clostridium tarantellae]
MNLMNKYLKYIKEVNCYEEDIEDSEYVEEIVNKDKLMLRGKNRRNIYSIERVRVGGNDRKR